MRNQSSESSSRQIFLDLKLTASVLDLFLEAAPDLEIKDVNGFEAIHYLYENDKISDEFKAEVAKKLVSKGNHVSEEMPWLGIDLPFLEKKLELLLGPAIPAAVKAVFEAVLSLFENEKQAAMIEKIAELETELLFKVLIQKKYSVRKFLI